MRGRVPGRGQVPVPGPALGLALGLARVFSAVFLVVGTDHGSGI